MDTLTGGSPASWGRCVDGQKADVEKKQVAKAVEVKVQGDSQDGEQTHYVPSQIQAAGQTKGSLLLQGLLREAEEDELKDSSLIVNIQTVVFFNVYLF